MSIEATTTRTTTASGPEDIRVTAAPARSHRLRRVVVIDDHPLFAESLDLVLTRAGYDVRKAEVPETAARTAALVAHGSAGTPTTVLLDLDLGRFGDGVRLIAPLVHQGATVVVLTGDTDRARWGECLMHGARKVLSKSCRLNDILAVLRRIDAGLPVLAPGEREALVGTWRTERSVAQSERDRLDRLTVREAEVLGELTLGRTVREIAARCFVSEATVRTQVKSILGKLEVSSQVAAVGLAHHVGWRSPVD